MYGNKLSSIRIPKINNSIPASLEEYFKRWRCFFSHVLKKPINKLKIIKGRRKPRE
jgi:hypothetical protein